jgi:hypothetical protein
MCEELGLAATSRPFDWHRTRIHKDGCMDAPGPRCLPRPVMEAYGDALDRYAVPVYDDAEATNIR